MVHIAAVVLRQDGQMPSAGLAAAVDAFGASVAARFATGGGEPEELIRGPFERLLDDLAELMSVAEAGGAPQRFEGIGVPQRRSGRNEPCQRGRPDWSGTRRQSRRRAVDAILLGVGARIGLPERRMATSRRRRSALSDGYRFGSLISTSQAQVRVRPITGDM